MDDTPIATTRFHLTESELSSLSSSCEIPVIRRAREAKQKNVALADHVPICVIVVGMAGSGKSTLMAQLQRSLLQPPPNDTEEKDSSSEKKNKVGYYLNLDPATKLVPFGASIDIRDIVDYKEVMIQHNLGPNGAIMTSLNLFATKFDQVLYILEKRSFSHESENSLTQSTTEDATTIPQNEIALQSKILDYILIDTPGQIEAFTWSASGSIMSESLASSFPTVLAFVVDTPRCASSASTFMSNMLYACSMLYRTHLPLIIVFNKIDVVPCQFAMEWMDDYERFQEILDEDSSGYYTSLTRSLSLVLDEFYTNLHKVGVSAATGDGIQEFWDMVDEAAGDFETDYLVDLRNRVSEQEAKKGAIARAGLTKLAKDVESSD